MGGGRWLGGLTFPLLCHFVKIGSSYIQVSCILQFTCTTGERRRRQRERETERMYMYM